MLTITGGIIGSRVVGNLWSHAARHGKQPGLQLFELIACSDSYAGRLCLVFRSYRVQVSTLDKDINKRFTAPLG
jgi:hypothetical protein